MFQIIRPKNLVLIALLQCFILFGSSDYNYLFFDIFKTGALVVSTLLIAAAGYIINDYFDVKIDLINKPGKVIIGTELSRRWAIILHISLTALGLLFAGYVNIRTFSVALLCAALLYLYSASLKKRFFIGNLLIALLAALTVIICNAYISELDNMKIIAYSFFAGISTLLREIVKDVEDEKGDSLFQSNSLPINLGLRRTKKIIFSNALLLLAAVIIYPVIVYEHGSMAPIFFWTYTIFLIFGLAFPTVLFLIRLQKADRQIDFAQLSRQMKIIMLIGIFSILLS